MILQQHCNVFSETNSLFPGRMGPLGAELTLLLLRAAFEVHLCLTNCSNLFSNFWLFFGKL